MIQIKDRYTGVIILKLETLIGANLSGANLAHADLSGANLSDADLSGAYLSRADLSGAKLSDAKLAGANLYRADLSGANLSRTYLGGADLSGANLSRAYIMIGAKRTEINSIIKLEFQFNKHLAVYFGGFIRIGCEYHSIKYWLSNFKKLGTKAKYTKSEIVAYGRWLKSIKAIVDKV